MALIQCPECGVEVSDKAPVCPRCGYPIAAEAAPPPEEAGGRAGLGASGLQDELRRRAQAQEAAAGEQQARRARTLRLLRFLESRGNPGTINCHDPIHDTKTRWGRTKEAYIQGWVLDSKPWGDSSRARIMTVLMTDGMLRTVNKYEDGFYVVNWQAPIERAALPDDKIADLLMRLGITDIPAGL